MGVLSQKRPRTQGLGSLAGAGRCGGWVTGGVASGQDSQPQGLAVHQVVPVPAPLRQRLSRMCWGTWLSTVTSSSDDGWPRPSASLGSGS